MPTLDLIVPFCNPIGWQARLANHRRFEDAMVATEGVQLITVELAYGDRPFVLPPRDGVTRLQYRTGDVLWHKENLIALAERESQAEYCGYCDDDLLFLEPRWVQAAIEALEINPIIQLWSQIVDLGPPPRNEARATLPSFMAIYENDYASHRAALSVDQNTVPTAISKHGNPGGAWAWRKRTYHEMGGMMDRCIVGAADHHMALGLVDCGMVNGYSPAYCEYIKAWRRQAYSAVRGCVGLLRGTVLHLWHGRRDDRSYQTRYRILVRNDYDPIFDVRPRHDGLLEWAGNKPLLRRDILDYLASRHEDSVDTVETDKERQRHHPHPPPRPPEPGPPIPIPTPPYPHPLQKG